jgi:hypothetical protein
MKENFNFIPLKGARQISFHCLTVCAERSHRWAKDLNPITAAAFCMAHRNLSVIHHVFGAWMDLLII